MLASTACEKQQNEKCFVGFNLFREKFPNLVEGYSNAGVALERLGRLDDAKFLYVVTLRCVRHATCSLAGCVRACVCVCVSFARVDGLHMSLWGGEGLLSRGKTLCRRSNQDVLTHAALSTGTVWH
jgi:hypothetical protein